MRRPAAGGYPERGPRAARWSASRGAAALALILLGALGCAPAEDPALGDARDPTPPSAGVIQAAAGPLPALVLPRFGVDGERDLAELRGPLVINLWASYCGSCVDEMPVIEEFHQRFMGRVGVLGIDYQDPQTAKAAELVERTGVTYELLADPGGELNGAGPFGAVRALPFWAFVDAEGRVVAQEYRVYDSVAELAASVRDHLGVAS